MLMLSLATLPPAIAAWQLAEFAVAGAFIRGFAMMFTSALMLGVLLLDKHDLFGIGNHLFSIFAAFILLPLMLAVPLNMASAEFCYWCAGFEMLSSLTTTGASLIGTFEGQANPVLVLYSASVSWFGAFMMIVIALAILEPANLGGFELTAEFTGRAGGAQSGGGVSASSRLLRAIKLIFPPFFLGTGLLYVLLVLSGEESLRALINALSVFATSGIALEGEGAAPAFVGELFIVIFLGLALSRNYLLQFARGSVRGVMGHDPEINMAMIFVAIVSIIAMVFALRHEIASGELMQFRNLLGAIWGAFFTAISFLSTHGVASSAWLEEFHHMPAELSSILLIGLAMIGGGIATSAGGIKLMRIYAVFLLTRREIARLVDPEAIHSSGRYGRQIRTRGGVNAFVFLMLFISGVSGAALGFSALGFGFEASLVSAIAAASNCGPLLGLIPEYGLVAADMRGPSALLFGATMIFGRMEILVLISLFNPEYWSEGRWGRRKWL